MTTLALAAGGTGGHMFPAQSVAEEAKARGWRVVLLTDARGLRYVGGFPADEVVDLPAANPTARGFGSKIGVARALADGTRLAGRVLKAERPFASVGVGGYPSAPAMFAARAARLPFGVHEQNAVLGRVNRRVAAGARFVAHGFERLDRLPKTRAEIVHTGNPVRRAVLDARAPYPGTDGPLRLLVFGGSQGASLFGRTVPGAVASLPDDLRARLSVVHQVGDEDRDAVASTYREARVVAELAPFFADLPQRLAAAHLVIARAGASSVTELSVLGRPAVLVPLGIAMDDHQTANAEVLASAGAAEVVAERDMTTERVAQVLAPLLADPRRLARMAEAARDRVPDGAAARVAELCEGLLGAGA